jgi:hypothetical protein
MQDSGMGILGDIVLVLNRGRIFLLNKIRCHLAVYRIVLLCMVATISYLSEIGFLIILFWLMFSVPGFFIRYVVFGGGKGSVFDESAFASLVIASDALVYVWKGFR